MNVYDDGGGGGNIEYGADRNRVMTGTNFNR
jgi:hypothetical protein